jgi:CBS domain-containing protein
MVEKVVTVTPDTSVRTVGSLMVERKIHRVMVVENDALVGLISTLDLVKALLVDA